MEWVGGGRGGGGGGRSRRIPNGTLRGGVTGLNCEMRVFLEEGRKVWWPDFTRRLDWHAIKRCLILSFRLFRAKPNAPVMLAWATGVFRYEVQLQ